MLQRILVFSTAFLFVSSLSAAPLPDMKMPDNGLPFKMIDGYQDYKIVATHWRIDKHELRYVLANPIAYDAIKAKKLPMPEGSKMVKIGWSVKPMAAYPDALEADTLQRIEFMVKDSKHFDQNGDHWGYARFVKKGDGYVPYAKGSEECVACHASVSQNDYLFSSFQETF
ncbi:cytochrome P460 family protein [Sulfuricurvum sp.]|uniref:cytochrome P460 family protein n=1 Tax=Sulfuricurvum sp. TaxID=2025608 RepID=UPI0026314ECE|nr:cytochrome P460 family protein [Sulfuricurvum sp.]MDD2266868.1 cytochrome P460 family protein [Sulfuricurvum sp.]MDD2784477.1 cytochrome P460 family protein [Sulfuricurvum sp.]HZF69684.1 cytochrome P460 family protein [Sulfuricurvum sp.]